MKRIICAVIAAGLLAAGPLRARAEEGAKDGGKRGERAERAEKMMKERLGLTDDQAAKLKAAWEAQKTAAKSLREKSKETARKLEEQVRDLASEKDIQATLDKLDDGRKAMAAERQKLEASVATILRPSQRAKLRLMMAARMKHRGHWGHGGHGARGGGEHARGGDGKPGDHKDGEGPKPDDDD